MEEKMKAKLRRFVIGIGIILLILLLGETSK